MEEEDDFEYDDDCYIASHDESQCVQEVAAPFDAVTLLEREVQSVCELMSSVTKEEAWLLLSYFGFSREKLQVGGLGCYCLENHHVGGGCSLFLFLLAISISLT